MTNSAGSDSDRTLWCGNLSDKITEEIIYELFLQAGPLESVKIPSDKDGRRRNFGFILFKHACSVPYALKLLSGVRLFGRSLNLQFRPGSVHMTPPGGGPQNDYVPRSPQMSQMPQLSQLRLPSPQMDDTGLPLFNGPNFTTRMGPPLPMQPLMSPVGGDRAWSASAMPLMQDPQNPHGGAGWNQRDRGRDRSNDRDRGRDRNERDHRHRDSRHGGRSRDYRNSSEDRNFSRSQERGRNSSQDRSNESGDMSLSRMRRGETYHGFAGQGGPAPPGDADHRRGGPPGGQQKSQRGIPPWQRPY